MAIAPIPEGGRLAGWRWRPSGSGTLTGPLKNIRHSDCDELLEGTRRRVQGRRRPEQDPAETAGLRWRGLRRSVVCSGAPVARSRGRRARGKMSCVPRLPKRAEDPDG